jgi:hypothetical protein
MQWSLAMHFFSDRERYEWQCTVSLSYGLDAAKPRIASRRAARHNVVAMVYEEGGGWPALMPQTPIR